MINKKDFSKKEFIYIIGAISFLRLLLVFTMGLMPQDAYYTYYSQELSLSYFDHPPMVAYMIKLFTLFFGKSAIALHLGDFIITSITLYFSYLLIKKLLPTNKVKEAFLLLCTAPFISVLCINTTPDIPLLFFWTAALLLILKAIEKQSILIWALAGLVSGCAFLGKYTAIFIPFGVLCYLLFTKELRKKIFTLGPIIYALMFIVGTLPIIIWNIKHDFISFTYQSTDRVSTISTFDFEFRLIFGYLGTQLLLGTPIIFIGMFMALLSNLKHKTWDNISKFTSSFSAPILLLFSAISFIYWVKLNWIMPVYFTGAILVVHKFNITKYLRWQIIFSFIIHILVLIEFVFMPISINSNDTWYGWNKLANKVEEIKIDKPSHFVFSDNSYKTTAALNFFSKEHVYAGNIVDKFAFQFGLDDKDLSKLEGEDAIYVSSLFKRTDVNYLKDMLKVYFDDVKVIDTLNINRPFSSKIERRFVFIECLDYKGNNKQ